MATDVIIDPSTGQIYWNDSAVSAQSISIKGDTQNTISIVGYSGSFSPGSGPAGATTLATFTDNSGTDALIPGTNGYDLGKDTARWRLFATSGTFSGEVNIASTTQSTSLLSGAIKIQGGLAVSSNASIGQTLFFYNPSNALFTAFRAGAAAASTTYTLPTNSPQSSVGTSVLSSTIAGVMSWVPLGSSSAEVYTGALYDVAYFATAGATVQGSSTLINNTASGQVKITHTTASFGTSSGALQVAGGVGISGKLSFNQASFGTTGITTIPTMAMIGQTGDPIFLSVLEDNSIVFEGSQGQLFSINPNLSTGYIWSVNDISGIPLIRANASGNVFISEFGGLVGLGNTNPAHKFHVRGSSAFATTNGASAISFLFDNISAPGSNTFQIKSANSIQLYNSADTFYTALKSNASTNVTYTLPATDGSNGQALTTNGSATLSWTTITGGSGGGGTGVQAGGEFEIAYYASTGASVQGSSTFKNDTTAAKVSVTHTTTSISSSTGALVVSGGVGIGGSLWVSGIGASISGVRLSHSIAYGSFVGNVTGNVSGTVTGNVQGNVTGNVSGTVTGNVQGNVTGNVSGTVTGNVQGNVTGNVSGNLTGNVVGIAITAGSTHVSIASAATAHAITVVPTTSAQVTVGIGQSIVSGVTVLASTGVISAGGFSGNVTGNISGNVTGNLSGSVTGNVQGNVTGNVSGTVTGNVQGNVTGNVSGTVTGNVQGNVTGNVSGNLTGNVVGTAITAGSTHVSIASAATAHAITVVPTTSAQVTVGIGQSIVSGVTVLASTGVITAGGFSGNVTGNVSGTVTGNVQGNVTGNVSGSVTGNVTGLATTSYNVQVAIGSENLSHTLLFTRPSSTVSGSGGIAVSQDLTLFFNPSTDILSTSGLAVTSTTNSISSTSGALIVTGGASVGQSLSIGGRLQIFNSSLSTAFLSAQAGVNTTYTLPTTSPAATGTSVLSSTMAGVMSWVPLTSTVGGSGTPGGSNKQIQYNNASSFGGASGFEYTTGGIAITVGFFAPSGLGYTSGLWVNAINGSTTRIGIGLSNPQFELEILGELSATNKSFVINHPTKSGLKLRYGSLEGPENGVYVRGELKGTNIIEVPDHWVGLVHEDSYTVHLTPIGKYTQLYVEKIENYNVFVAENNNSYIHCYYSVWAERKDIPKLVTEYEAQ